MKSQRRTFLTLAFVLAVTTTVNVNAKQVAPESGELMTLDIAGKQSTYYRIQKDSSLFVTLSGPGTLTGIVRLITPSETHTNVTYTLIVSDGKKLVKTLNSTTSSSQWNWLGNSEGAGKSRKFHVRIGEGKHRLRFSLKNTLASAAGIRFNFDKSSPHVGESPLYPLSMREQVTVQVRERSLDYAIMDAETPVTVRIIGPTRLRIVSRLLYSGLMKGPKQYSIVSRMDNRKLPAKKLKTKKSFTTKIINHPEWISGRSRTFYVPIPEGEHVVSFRMSAMEAPGVALRFSIPKEDTRK